MSNDYKSKVGGVRSRLAEFYSKYGYFLPRRKVLAGALAAGAVAVLQDVLPGFNLPDGYAEIAAYALVAYFTGEEPDVSLSVGLEFEDPLDPAEGYSQYGQSDVPPEFTPNVPAGEPNPLDDDRPRGV